MTAHDDPQPDLFAIDTGGTMTDSFIVSRDGAFTVGKAQSTPDDEARGVMASFADGLEYWGTDVEAGAPALRGTIYSGTAMLNRLLEREGDSNIGVIVNRGFEDLIRFGRGIQSWVELSYSGRLHAREHEHPEPLVPRQNVRGVSSRIDNAGEEIMPLYEHEVRQAVDDFLDKGVRVIIVCLLYSYKNPIHERRVKAIATEMIDAAGADIPVWLSSDQNPVRRETPRLNTLLVEAYAVEPSRKQLYNVRDALEERGSSAPFRIVTATGGTISPDHDWLADTLVSGPIGGLFGGERLCEELGIDKLVCSDVGGTSFEAGLITEGHYPTRWDQSIAKFILNTSTAAMDTIGSGTGSFVRIDRASNRVEVGPDSAGYRVGVCNEAADVATPTVTDCAVVLGYLNPDYFLGGDIELDVGRAEAAIETDLAAPLGQDVHETARGVIDIVERDMTNELSAMVLGLGFSPENYHLVSYGGGGPLHVAGYTEPLDFQDILIPQWAAAFSAFGCACTDYAYRFERSLELEIDPDLANLERVSTELSTVLGRLQVKTDAAFDRDGIDRETTTYRPALRVRYTGMLNDLEVTVPTDRWDGEIAASGVRAVVDRYEEKFERIFQRAAKSPEQGFTVTMVIGTGIAPSPTPTIPSAAVDSTNGTPPEAAHKGEREIFWDDRWHRADVVEMGDLDAGNELGGPTIVESPATTLLVPPGFETRLDGHRIFHLSRAGGRT